MTYATLAEVKALLRETTSDHDTEITTSIEDADDFIDSFLQLHETVPLASPPDQIKKASKYLAASLFFFHDPTTEQQLKQAEGWWRIGELMLSNYITYKYFQGEMRG